MPSAVAPSCHGPSSTENAISLIVLSASCARATARGYVTVRPSIAGRALSIENIVLVALVVSVRSGEFAGASDAVTRTRYQPSGYVSVFHSHDVVVSGDLPVAIGRQFA